MFYCSNRGFFVQSYCSLAHIKPSLFIVFSLFVSFTQSTLWATYFLLHDSNGMMIHYNGKQKIMTKTKSNKTKTTTTKIHGILSHTWIFWWIACEPIGYACVLIQIGNRPYFCFYYSSFWYFYSQLWLWLLLIYSIHSHLFPVFLCVHLHNSNFKWDIK